MKIPHKEPVCQPIPGRSAVPQAVKQIRAEPLDRSSSLQASTRLMAMGITMAILTVMDGVRAERASPIMNQLIQMVR